MSKPLRIGLAGLGTVGCGIVRLLQENAELIQARTGRSIVVVSATARDLSKKRDVSLDGIRLVDAPEKLLEDPEADVIVEVIGGAEGVAKELVEKALKAGKPVVTANKALIAHHGLELARMAEASGVVLAFEAAVAGGIPVVKGLREGLAANRFQRVVGILNGTCNFILSAMWQQKKSFDEMLKKAQELGYAEAEPSFDVDGIDAAHKLAIMASIAFGGAPAIDKVHVEGIREVHVRDMAFADELGYCIKLLGIASYGEDGLRQRVHPCLVPKSSPLANVHDVYNAVVAEGSDVGKVFIEGRGAGAGPTASSVVADIMDIARGFHYFPFSHPTSSMTTPDFVSMDKLEASYYLRMSVMDKPGVLAEITDVLRRYEISVHSFLQRLHQPGEEVQLVLTTHRTTEKAMQDARAELASLPPLNEPPYMIRIEDL